MKTSPLTSPIKGEKEKVEENSSPSLIRLSLYVSSFPPHMFGDTPTLFYFATFCFTFAIALFLFRSAVIHRPTSVRRLRCRNILLTLENF